TRTETVLVVVLPAASSATTFSPAGGAGNVSVNRPPRTVTICVPATTRVAPLTVPLIVTGVSSDAAVDGASTVKRRGVASTTNRFVTVAPPAVTDNTCVPSARPVGRTDATPSCTVTATGRPSMRARTRADEAPRTAMWIPLAVRCAALTNAGKPVT